MRFEACEDRRIFRLHFTIAKGIIGDMGAVHARVGADTRAEGDKLCAKLRAAGWYCDVLRN